jgi:hypothetical protein
VLRRPIETTGVFGNLAASKFKLAHHLKNPTEAILKDDAGTGSFTQSAGTPQRN